MSIAKFYKWLATFMVVLLLIPILAHEGYSGTLIFGIILVALSTLAIFHWVKSLFGHDSRREPIKLSSNDVFWLEQSIPFYKELKLSDNVYSSNFEYDNKLSKLGSVQGKVYHGGLMNNTMILSLPALISGFSIANDKKNVGVHEFAHLLDKADGVIDGVPYNMCEKDRKIWSK